MKMKSLFNLMAFSLTALSGPIAIADEACQSQKYIVLSTCTEYPKLETIMSNALQCSLVSSNWQCSVEFPAKLIETIYLPYSDKTLRKETNFNRHVFIIHEAYSKEDVIALIKKDIQARIRLYGCTK